jgi:large-conductance mechanosensitive channel
MLRRIRDWLLRIPVLVVCAVAVVLSALFGLVVDRAGEAGVLFVPPLFALWVVTWALALTHAHRAVGRSRHSLVRFGAPIAAALAFVVCTAYVGQFIASWFSTPSFPHQRVLP